MTFEHPMLWVALAGVAAALWRQIRDLAAQAARRLVAEHVVHPMLGPLPAALIVHLRANHRRVALGSRTYYGSTARVRPLKRSQLVAFEFLDNQNLFLVGGRPLWVTVGGAPGEFSLQCRWIRGTVDFDALLLAAADGLYTLTAPAADSDHAASRFYCRRVVGRPGRPRHGGGEGRAKQADVIEHGAGSNTSNGPAQAVERASPLANPILRHAVEPVGWSLDDIDHGSSLPGSAVDRLALAPAVLAAVDDVRRWHTAREWYEGRDIPWRHGVLFHGAPGNGKSTLVRALGRDLGLPILAFDLASLDNAEFLEAWGGEVRQAAPCIALFEDIDAVFDGRENVTGREDGLTFDCLLNALGGVEVADGVLVVITTNRPGALDPAIASVGGATSRPGRIEAVVELGPPDAAGRRKIAARVLVDCPGLVDAAVEAGRDESGAQFLDRCRKIALDHRNGVVPAEFVPIAGEFPDPDALSRPPIDDMFRGAGVPAEYYGAYRDKRGKIDHITAIEEIRDDLEHQVRRGDLTVNGARERMAAAVGRGDDTGP